MRRHQTRGKRLTGWARSACAALGLIAGTGLVGAAPEDAGPRGTREPADALQRAEQEKARQAESLRQVQDALTRNASNRASLEAEVAAIGSDRTKLNVALLDAARQAQATEDRLTHLEERLRSLGDGEAAIRRSLDARRGIIAEILAALQRMGRRPPPAVLVRPEDVLAVIRTSMLLGAVVPELRGEAETLAADLTGLLRVRGQIAADRESLKADLLALAREKARLDALVAARAKRVGEIEGSLASERQRSTELGAQARSLTDLVERMEGEVASARASEAREARQTQERFAAAGIRDPARLAPKSRFADTRGEVIRPVSGRVVRGFNQPDGNGGTTRGIALATRSKASVSSPSDGWVAFAGPFRSYGRLLIINAGDGYYLLLAGMERIDVEVGQFVLAGEPVAVMGQGTGPGEGTGGSAPQAASSRSDDRADPILYVEFRKDGGSIDPEPWWARSFSEKVRG